MTEKYNVRNRMCRCIIMAFAYILFVPLPSMADGLKFTEEEVVDTIIEYINIVFGTKPPTLKDRIRFEGLETHEMDELPLMYGMCKREMRIVRPENSKECFDKIVTPRLDNQKKYKSLYYDLVRKALRVSPDDLRIESIQHMDEVRGKTAGYYLVTINISSQRRNLSDNILARKKLLLIHSERHESDLKTGFVGLFGVVTPMHEYIDSWGQSKNYFTTE